MGQHGTAPTATPWARLTARHPSFIPPRLHSPANISRASSALPWKVNPPSPRRVNPCPSAPCPSHQPTARPPLRARLAPARESRNHPSAGGTAGTVGQNAGSLGQHSDGAGRAWLLGMVAASFGVREAHPMRGWPPGRVERAASPGATHPAKVLRPAGRWTATMTRDGHWPAGQRPIEPWLGGCPGSHLVTRHAAHAMTNRGHWRVRLHGDRLHRVTRAAAPGGPVGASLAQRGQAGGTRLDLGTWSAVAIAASWASHSKPGIAPAVPAPGRRWKAGEGVNAHQATKRAASVGRVALRRLVSWRERTPFTKRARSFDNVGLRRPDW